jgi:hypothetical protein
MNFPVNVQVHLPLQDHTPLFLMGMGRYLTDGFQVKKDDLFAFGLEKLPPHTGEIQVNIRKGLDKIRELDFFHSFSSDPYLNGEIAPVLSGLHE